MIYLALALLSSSRTIDLPAGPGPLDNPMKGFASYCGPNTQLNCAVSMDFEETSWKSLEPSEGHFAFSGWEKKWDFGPNANRQVVLRVFLDYPHQAVAVPQWLIDKGVKMTKYDEFGGGSSPDYEDARLQTSLSAFIEAFGKRYDHDPRIAYVQLGLLGHWGEWHTYPHDSLFASDKVQSQVIEEMHQAFPDKPLMARNAQYKSCQLPWIGFHDDMIPDDTLGKEDWEFLPAIQKGGVSDNWKVAPLGGEMVPGAAAQYLGKDWDLLTRAVKETHFSWIGPYCPAMKQNPTPEERSRIDELIRMLGYQFRLTKATIGSEEPGRVSAKVEGLNEGVAPMYVNWRPSFVLLDEQGKVVKTLASKSDPRSWLPGSFSFEVSGEAPKGQYRVGAGIVNPATGKADIRFANSLDVVKGFAVLGQVEVR